MLNDKEADKKVLKELMEDKNEVGKEQCEHPQIVYLGDGVSQCRKCFELFEDE